MVLVPVGDEQPPQPGAILHQIRHIRYHAVDAVHIITGERHTAVHHDDLAAILVGGHVLADLIQTAKRNDFQFFCHKKITTPSIIQDRARPPGKKTAAKHRRSVPPACPASQGEGTVSRPMSALDGGGHTLPFVILTAASTHRETTKKHAPNPALFTKYTTKLSVCTPPTYRQPSPRLDTRPKFPFDFTKSVLSPPPFRAIINYYYCGHIFLSPEGGALLE